MVDSNSYRKAAELISNGESRYSCLALNKVLIYERSQLHEFREVFNPKNSIIYWWGFQLSEQSQMARSLALLFMAEMARSLALLFMAEMAENP